MTTRSTDALRAKWAERGYVVTDADVETAQQHLAASSAITDAQHAENLAWLARFDSSTTAA